MAKLFELPQELEKFKCKIALALQEIADLDVSCKSILGHYIKNFNLINAASIIKIQAVIDNMYEKVNIGNWKEVPVHFRKTITIASYLKLFAHINSTNYLTDGAIVESFKIIDFGILFGCPVDSEPQLLQKCATALNRLSMDTTSNILNPVPEQTNKSQTCIEELDGTQIEVIDCPSMECFYKEYIVAEKPVVLQNCMTLWPALTKWKDQNYLIKLAGLRMVPIELGSKYTDTDWTQKLMTVGEFIKSHVYQSDGPTGYLAQYQLFAQIPELKEDIIEPEYCCFSESNEPVDINAWYGPKGTISPLHHDPKRNLLAQVVGEKVLYLFSPADSQFLYPHEHELLNNTAQVDPRHPDLEKYPKYKDAKAHYCILKPGQMLYIPPKWWHFVESLSISFSVSFWWE